MHFVFLWFGHFSHFSWLVVVVVVVVVVFIAYSHVMAYMMHSIFKEIVPLVSYVWSTRISVYTTLKGKRVMDVDWTPTAFFPGDFKIRRNKGM